MGLTLNEDEPCKFKLWGSLFKDLLKIKDHKSKVLKQSLGHGSGCGCIVCTFKRKQVVHGGEKRDGGGSAVRRYKSCGGERTKDLS